MNNVYVGTNMTKGLLVSRQFVKFMGMSFLRRNVFLLEGGRYVNVLLLYCTCLLGTLLRGGFVRTIACFCRLDCLWPLI